METTDYGFRTQLHVPFERGLGQVADALKAEGFGILTEIDVTATLKKKLGIDFREYRILGACNPPLAHRALQVEEDIGLLLPCNVVVQETETGVSVATINPVAAMSMVKNEKLPEIAREASAKLQRVIHSLEKVDTL